MSQQVNSGEVSLVYNKDGKAYAVELTREQHLILQACVSAISPIKVVRELEVEYLTSKK